MPTTAPTTAETDRGPRFCQQASAHCRTAGTLPSQDRSSRPRRSYLTVIPSPSVQIKCSQTRARYATSPLPARRSHHVAPHPSCVPAAIPLLVVLTSRSDTEGRSLRLPHVRGCGLVHPPRHRRVRACISSAKAGMPSVAPLRELCQYSSGAAQTARTDAVLDSQPATSVQVYLASSLPLCSSLPRAGVRRALVLPWGVARRSPRPRSGHAPAVLLCNSRCPHRGPLLRPGGSVAAAPLRYRSGRAAAISTGLRSGRNPSGRPVQSCGRCQCAPLPKPLQGPGLPRGVYQ